MIAAILITAASILPHDVAMRETCACVERNHFYSDEGRLVFSQFIFLDWEGNRHEVAGWRLETAEFRFHPPVVTWTDGGKVRQIRGSYWRETWTQFDPELVARETLPACKRRGVMGQR